jgi:hypothetical protein
LVLVGDAGTGTLDTATPLSDHLPIFAGGAGVYGKGGGPKGGGPKGGGFGKRLPGKGGGPKGGGPKGFGCVPVQASVEITECGTYQFALLAYDAAGNCKTDTPDIQTETIHVTPAAPDPFTRHTVADGVLTLIL